MPLLQPVFSKLRKSVGSRNVHTRLPTELWIHILSLVEESRDLLTLSHVSGDLRTLVQPFFRNVNLPLRQTYAILKKRPLADYAVLKILQNRQRAIVVTSLSIVLPCFKACEHTLVAGGLVCDTLDQALTESLYAMANLEVLDIDCQLCYKDGRHAFITKLRAPRLRTLSFNCHCNTRIVINLKREHSFSMFDNLEALKWTSSTPSRTINLSNPARFPKLYALGYYGAGMEASIIANRPIRRLYVGDIRDRRFYPVLDTCMDTLTHVIFKYYINFRTPLLFSNLQHVGTVPVFVHFTSLAEFIDSHVASLTSLPLLTSIDALSHRTLYRWGPEALSYLHSVNPNIRRVLTHGYDSWVWRLKGDTWQGQKVPSFSTWDIIRGICDLM